MKNILIGLIISVVLFSIVMRILNVYILFPFFIEYSKDVDFILLYRGFWENGLINFYNQVTVPEYVPEWPPYYLYFWYFIFFPIGLLPIELSVIIWNIISGVIVIYICLKCYDKYNNALDVRNFYSFLLVGFLIDIWYGNSNFLILLFLFLSYEFLERDQKWISGIFFSLATFKINAILFIPFLLLSKKIKFKELYYYIVPFVLFCLPYVLFPDFLFQMFDNWAHSDAGIQGLTPLDPIIWKALQPSHLLYISYFYLFYMEHFEDNERKKIIRRIIITGFSIYYAYITLIVFIIPISFTFI